MRDRFADWCALTATRLNSSVPAWVVVLVAIAAFGGLASNVVQIRGSNDLTAKVNDNLQSQTANRAYNVSVWCGALTEDRMQLRAYVAAIPGAPQIQFKPLNCTALEHATVKSTKAVPTR